MLSKLKTMDERKQRGAILRVMCLSLMMVVAAVASLNVALPAIARDIGATQTQLQWIVDAYALSFAALLLPAGAIGDRFGRKPVLAFGLALFGSASLVALFAHSPAAADRPPRADGRRRRVRDARDAVRHHDRVPAEERGKAVGTWAGVAAGGGVLGLVTSGVLLEWFDWPSVFGLNVVLAVLALAGTLAVVPSTRAATRRASTPSARCCRRPVWRRSSTASSRAPSAAGRPRSPSPRILAGVAAIAAFVGWELRRDEPMLDPRNFLRRGFGAGSLSITVQFFAVFGFLFLALPYLQLVLGLLADQGSRGAAADGPARDPALARLAAAGRAPGRAGRRRRRPHVDGDRLPIFATMDVGTSYWHFLLGLVPFGAGIALAGAPATTAIIASLPPEKQGVASAVNDVSRELGGALGIAVLGSLFNAAYRSSMTEADRLAAGRRRGARPRSSLAAAEQIGAPAGRERRRARSPTPRRRSWTASAAGSASVPSPSLLGALFVALRAPGRAESTANAGVAHPGAEEPALA